MLLSDFSFDLPSKFIATSPVFPREEGKLLIIPSDGVLEDKKIQDFIRYLKPNDHIIANNSAVIPARIFGSCDNVKVEVVLLKKKLIKNREGIFWEALAKPGKKIPLHSTIIFGNNFEANVECKEENGTLLLHFSLEHTLWDQYLALYGSIPLPPYILKKRDLCEEDRMWYQTIYALHPGSVACPTAGLHFSEAMLEKIKNKNCRIDYITLHVGAGTFLPVKSEDITSHKIHTEYGNITPEIADRINTTKKLGGRIIAIGTTSLRLLESATDAQGVVHPFSEECSLFIMPGYRFKIVDLLFSNFHLPCSTLFMLVCAFGGREKMLKAYHHAMSQDYRFYSYGDATLIYPDHI